MLYWKNLHWLLLSFIVVIVDQLTKYLAIKHLVFLQQQRILPFFNFTLAYNPGAAFSFLSVASGWQRWFFIGIAFAICLLIIVWLMRLPKENKWFAIGLSLVFGGAIGNLIDRIIFGYVIDFIDLHVQQWHWPVFNIADSAVCVGVFILIIELLFFHKQKH